MVAAVKNFSHRPKKMVLMGILLGAMFLVFIFGSVIVKAQNKAANPNENLYYTNLTVNNGDTLWDIASEYMDYNHYYSTTEYLNEIKRINNLTSDDLYIGQNIIITYYDDKSN